MMNKNFIHRFTTKKYLYYYGHLYDYNTEARVFVDYQQFICIPFVCQDCLATTFMQDNGVPLVIRVFMLGKPYSTFCGTDCDKKNK